MTDGSGVAYAYLGTSDFAASVLRDLAGSPHPPSLVVTPPDRRSGRGRKVSPPPVAEVAAELGLELHQTASVNEDASREAILASGADLGVVCAFGQLIKPELLEALPMLNAHPSLLPRWRGAAPVERAIMAGDATTGTCVMRLTEGLDSGPVALREETPIGRRGHLRVPRSGARRAERAAADRGARPLGRGSARGAVHRAARRGRHLRGEDRARRPPRRHLPSRRRGGPPDPRADAAHRRRRRARRG